MERPRALGEPPIPPRELIRSIKELRGLVAEAMEVSEAADLWGIRTLRRHVEIALSSPTTLTSARNQVDFVESLQEAVWEAADTGFGGLRPGESWEETGRRQERLEHIRAALDATAEGLAERVEAWRRRRGLSG